MVRANDESIVAKLVLTPESVDFCLEPLESHHNRAAFSRSDRMLYLAVPLDTFDSFFQERFVQEALKIYQVKLIVYEPQKEIILVWKE